MYHVLRLIKGQQNLCPFPHKKQETGKWYMEKEPSCGINEDGAFKCFVCERKFTDEDWFTASYLNCSHQQAQKFNQMLRDTRTFLPQKEKWRTHQKRLFKELKDDESHITEFINELGVLKFVKSARLGLYQGHVTLPTFYKGQIINLCQFCPGETPKYLNSSKAITGVITTTRQFDQDAEEILLCAGEKDMLIATTKGFNAITILGGEKAKPVFFKNLFKNKTIYIAYDNDEAGIAGAVSLAEWLYRYTTKIKVLNVTHVYDESGHTFNGVAKENKEDIADFFIKYKKTDVDLNNVIDNTKWYQPPALENQSLVKLVSEAANILKELRKKLDEPKR